MFAAVTDHVFIDGGHTIDFTNKAFEAVDHLGKDAAGEILPTLVRQTTAASRSEEFGEWRHPAQPRGARPAHDRRARRARSPTAARAAAQFDDVGALGWQLLDDDPEVVAAALLDALRAGADEEQIGRAIAYAAALRIARFHVQNDHGDWDTVHHAFTAANGLHQALQRRPSTELLRGAVHAALRINLDRFLNVPAARLPHATSGSLDALAHCFDVQGMVDEAGNEAYGFLRGGGTRAELVAALGHALLAEDAEFHWYQMLEAGVRQSQQWPEGSEEAALVLTAVARFLAAHTPTRRELPTVVRIATRLRRGEALYEDEDEPTRSGAVASVRTRGAAVDARCGRLRDERGRELAPVGAGHLVVGADHLDAHVVGAGVAHRPDAGRDRVEVAPRDDRVDEPVAPLLGEVVVAVAELAQVVRVVRQADVDRGVPAGGRARRRRDRCRARPRARPRSSRRGRASRAPRPRARAARSRDARRRRDRAASPSIRGRERGEHARVDRERDRGRVEAVEVLDHLRERLGVATGIARGRSAARGSRRDRAGSAASSRRSTPRDGAATSAGSCIQMLRMPVAIAARGVAPSSVSTAPSTSPPTSGIQIAS